MAKGKKISYTQQGYQQLVDELQYLKIEKREKIKNDIAVARSFGDLSENAEYDEARNEQAKNEARIKELEELLENAVIVDENTLDTSVAGLGSTVRVLDTDRNEETTYLLVGSNEVDPMEGKISDQSPIGAALILAQLGARALTDQEAAKNILTVMAILSVLPTANLAAPLLASWKYRTPPQAFYDRCRPLEQKGTVLYDLILTSKEQVMPMDAVLVHPQGVIALCSRSGLDTKKAEQFLNGMFSAHKLDPHVRVFTDEKTFRRRADALQPADQYEDDGSTAYAAGLLKNLSM